VHRREEGIEAYRKAVSLAPRETIPRVDPARPQWDAGRWADGIRTAETASATLPDEGECWLALAEALLSPDCPTALRNPVPGLAAARRAAEVQAPLASETLAAAAEQVAAGAAGRVGRTVPTAGEAVNESSDSCRPCYRKSEKR
jgi:hypothetical protein